VTWTLFVDESGDLDGDGDRAVVAALLLPGSQHAPLQRDLRSQLGEVFAGLPWPPHTSTLNIPAAIGVATGQVPAHRRPPALAELYQALRPQLEGTSLDDWQALRVLDERIADRQPELHAGLRALRANHHAGVRGVLSRLAAGAHGATPLALVAADQVDHDRNEEPAGALVVRDPYVRLLRLILEQVHALLWHDGRGVEVVEAVVADRNLRLAGTGQRVPLLPRYLDEISREAWRAPFLANKDARRQGVRIVPTGRQRFRGEGTPAGLVLADWLANRARRALHSNRPLAATLQSLDAMALGGLARSRRPALAADAGSPLPTLAWGGEARSRVHAAATTGRPQPTHDLAPPLWAPEATEPWVQAAATGTWR